MYNYTTYSSQICLIFFAFFIRVHFVCVYSYRLTPFYKIEVFLSAKISKIAWAPTCEFKYLKIQKPKKMAQICGTLVIHRHWLYIYCTKVGSGGLG